MENTIHIYTKYKKGGSLGGGPYIYIFICACGRVEFYPCVPGVLRGACQALPGAARWFERQGRGRAQGQLKISVPSFDLG